MNRLRPGESRSPARSSNHSSPGGEWPRKTVRELEVELETAAHFIRKMQETEEVLSNHVRDVVAEKNDAVQALTRMQGRVAGLESELAKVKSVGQKADTEYSETQRELARVKREQANFEDRVMAKAKAERHELQVNLAEMEGKLMVEAAKQQPLMEQVESLKAELDALRNERKEQDELIGEQNKAVRELQSSREGVMATLMREQDLSKHAVSRLEGALESAGIDQARSEAKQKRAWMSAGTRMVAGVLRRQALSGARLAVVQWRDNLRGVVEAAQIAFKEDQVQATSQASGLRLMRSVLARVRFGALARACTAWRTSQLNAVAGDSTQTCTQLQERLDMLVAEHEQTLEELRRSEEEKHRLQVQLKEGNAERQILVMEVENLKTVGEQLVSDLVATTSEVFDELMASRGDVKVDRITEHSGPTAQRLARSVGSTGMLPRGR